MIKNILIFIIVGLTILIFQNYPIVNANIIMACDLFIRRIFPSLFPMFIISSILINLNFIKYINFFFHKICRKLFNLNNNTSYIFFMSLISGFPSNAKIAKDMYDLGLIAEKDIQKIILFTHFSNPLFIITMVTHHKILVLLAHYIGNLIIGIILRNKYVSSSGHSQPITNTDISFTENLTNAINSSISTLLFILGTIVTFFIISSVINLPIFKFILEISQGLNYINGLDISIKVKTILSGALLSFGGVCVHYQVYGILNKVKIKYMPYLLARIGHVLITIFIILIFYP